MDDFENDEAELKFLRYAVGHLFSDPGRLTAGGSASHDLGWDLLEEYYNHVYIDREERKWLAQEPRGLEKIKDRVAAQEDRWNEDYLQFLEFRAGEADAWYIQAQVGTDKAGIETAW